MPPRAATAGCGKCYEPDGGFRRSFPLYLLIEEKCESVSRESSESERVSVMQCERLVMLRKKFGLSQESMAERFHVSRQAVQKWENGSSVPDIERLIDIARFFNVSLDTLLREEDVRSVDELRLERDIVPHYQALTDWDLYSSTLRTEYRQSLEEGRDVARYQKVFESVAELSPDRYKEALADVLFNVVKDAPQREEYPYNEPSDLENIRKLRAKTDRTFHPAENLRNRLYGAWIGRISGCALGKPLEGIRRGELEKVLKATGNYPLHRHVRDGELTEEILGSVTYNLRGRCFADTLDFEPADDDTNYTVLGMKLIERHGRDFTPADVADIWVALQPKNAYCTAERVAFRNFVNGYVPPFSAEYKNAYREWIGAQIRADYFGYVNPGDPETAAEMAWRDASISHIKNGIYGEMLVAAMLAAAACTGDIREVIACGMAEIPATSRMYEQLACLLENVDGGMTYEVWSRDFHSRWDEADPYDWCHVLSNAELVVASLLYGGGDYAKSICMAVENGFDTDCNGATVGSILGMMRGIDGIPEEWYAFFHDTLDTSIFGVGKVNVADLVDGTLAHMAK